MARYAKLKKDTKFYAPGSYEFSITIPEGTIVKTEHWNNDYKLLVVDPYSSVCRKIDLEFLE